MCRNFNFQKRISKIYAIIFFGNAQVKIIKASFMLTPIHTIDGVKSRP